VSSAAKFVCRLIDGLPRQAARIEQNNRKTAYPMKTTTNHSIVTPSEWLAARKELLAEEKRLTRQMDAVSAKRRALPWVKIDKDYQFDSRKGRVSLDQLFAGRSQLVIQHFMLGPGWGEGCPSCSYMADHTDGMLPHLAARDVTMIAVSRAPLAEIETFKKRMGWGFDWVSSNSTDFNYDFHVSFTEKEVESGKVDYNYTKQPFGSTEAPGISVFQKGADGSIYHTYSVYGRGVELMMGTYRILDLTPKGRDEDNLEHSMAWVRYHDSYDTNSTKCGCH
jgi:predicted dithiol-disulfide oxidoreductase (DUF899 family)